MASYILRIGSFTALAVAGVLATAKPGTAAPLMPDFATVPTGWTTDRYDPASFSNIGSFAGRSDVLGIGIDGTTGSTSRPGGQQGSFYNTQGRQFTVSGGAGSVIAADLYVPLDWANPALGARRTDAWGVLAGGPGLAYPILGFTNFGGAARFRAYDAESSPAGWVDLSDTINFDDWNALSIEFTGTSIEYSVNGVLAYTDATLTTPTGFNALIMQAYNFDDPTISGAVANEYVALWSNTEVPEPGSLAVLALAMAGLATLRRRVG